MSLFDWARSVGCTWPEGVEFRRDEERGVHCVCTDQLDEGVIRIPLEVVFRGSLACEYFQLNEQEMKCQNSWLKLLFSRIKYGDGEVMVNGEDLAQKFSSYIQELPQLVNSPLMWHPQEVSDLLRGTNLGSSVYEKLSMVLQEWSTVIKSREQFINAETQPYLDMLEVRDPFKMYEILVQPLLAEKKNSQQDKLHWLSFPAFLYSHLIFTSRAFPEYVVNPQCEEVSVVLLPIIDLLNHDYNAKVQWYPEEIQGQTYFCYKNLNTVQKGNELFNNYGGKGNEELLMGYGFVLEENIFDAVALRIKSPSETIADILDKYPGIELPTMENYTTFAFDLAKERTNQTKTKTVEDFKDGVMYFVNSTNESALVSLIDLFSYMKLQEKETYTNLRPRLDGIQMLKVAFKQKLDNATQYSPVLNEDESTYKSKCATIYRNSQIAILRNVMTNLKRIEKNLFRENKNSLLSMDKVMKNDPSFTSEELPMLFQGQDSDDIVFDSSLDLFVLWIILKIQNKSFVKKYKDIETDLSVFMANYNTEEHIEEATDFKTHLALPQTSQIPIETVAIAIAYVNSHVVTRLNSKCEEDDTIFVR